MGTLGIYKSKFDENIRKLKMGGVKLSPVICAIDGVLDFILYGSTITDYFELTFWRKKAYEKSQYCTWRIHKRFIYEVDDSNTIRRLSDKAVMYKRLHSFINRDQVYTKDLTFEEFQDFCNKHPVFFFKPCGNSCGEGIDKISTNEQKLEELFVKIKKEDAVLDTPVAQHRMMAALNESSVNTLRIFTFRNDGVIYFTGCALRIGTNSFIDNYSAGGLVCAVDMKTGCTMDKAENSLGQRFSQHPYSHTSLVGFEVPRWKEVISFVFNMASSYDLNYVAWDVAIGKDSIELIEANPAGMINVIQIAGNRPKKDLVLNLEKKWRASPKSTYETYKIIICD